MCRACRIVLIVTIAFIDVSVGRAQGGITQSAVKERGFVHCGISKGIPGFSHKDAQGNWSGLDVDICKAVAAAVLGDANKAKFTPLAAKEERFTALQGGEIDLLTRNTTWTLTRDTALALNFAGVNYYDGQGFMIPKSLGVRSALQLNGAKVCVKSGTTSERNLADYFRMHKMRYQAVASEDATALVKAYEEGRCNVYTSDQSQLYAERTLLESPADHIILPEVISKEPLGPVVRHGDDEWLDTVSWSLYCMLNAEELGVSSDNLGQMAHHASPKIRYLLGIEGDAGKALGLAPDWCRTIIEQVGNYGQSFDRNLGQDTALNIERGLNSLWSHGGLMYAPPMR